MGAKGPTKVLRQPPYLLGLLIIFKLLVLKEIGFSSCEISELLWGAINSFFRDCSEHGVDEKTGGMNSVGWNLK